jgi:hypothetical protein
MPLAKGKSNKVVGKNIQTLVDDYQKSGRIGTSKPANKKAAVKQATAIALSKAGRTKPKKFATGGSINDPFNFEVAPGVSYEEQFAKDYKTQAQKEAAAKEAEPTPTPEARERQRLSPATNLPSDPNVNYQNFRRTRPNVKFYVEDIDVRRPVGNPVKPAKTEQKAMKKGGKVSVKKRRA